MRYNIDKAFVCNFKIKVKNRHLTRYDNIITYKTISYRDTTFESSFRKPDALIQPAKKISVCVTCICNNQYEKRLNKTQIENYIFSNKQYFIVQKI
jgi:hypothetical protein